MLGMTRQPLHSSDFYRVEMLFGDRVVRVVRQARPFETEQDVETACVPLQAVLDAAGRAGRALLVDSRAVVGRNDPTSERAFASHRSRMLHGFRAAALLMQTATGKLQSERLLREHRLQHVPVFLQEEDAFVFLDGMHA